MLLALFLALACWVAAFSFITKTRKKVTSQSLLPAWSRSDLPLLVLIDERGPRAEALVKEAIDAWNTVSKRRFFAFGGYESNIEAFMRPTPGILTIRFLAGFEERIHTQLFYNHEGRLRASPILAPTEASDGLLVQIVTHELGHALGLGHNSDVVSVMFERPIPTALRITLSDLRALEALYPRS